MPSNKAKGGQKKQKERRRRTADKLAALPSWPPLQPLVPASDLKLETLLEDQVFVIRNFFTATLCRKYVRFLSSLPLSTTPITPKDGEAVRVNDRIQFEDPNFARQLWTATALQQLLSGSEQPDKEETLSIAQAQKLWGGDLCGLNDRIRMYRYTPGQFFAQHCRLIFPRKLNPLPVNVFQIFVLLYFVYPAWHASVLTRLKSIYLSIA